MEILSEAENTVRTLSGSVATIGSYDGIHMGHRKVIEALNSQAKALGVPSVVVTFDQHPALIVRPETAPLLLTNLELKLALLEELGVDVVYVIHFDQERSKEDAGEFAENLLVRTLKVRGVFVGEDFHFGRGRSGDLKLLRNLGAKAKFEAKGVILTPVRDALGSRHVDADLPISSSLVRSYVAAGRVEESWKLLGRPHCLRGVVVGGDKRGSTQLGYPTANLEIPNGLAVPSDGIYVGYLRLRGGTVELRAAISIGSRPTFYALGAKRLIESFVLDFDENLYGSEVEVGFYQFLREQAVFDGPEALSEQIALDVAMARRFVPRTRSRHLTW